MGFIRPGVKTNLSQRDVLLSPIGDGKSCVLKSLQNHKRAKLNSVQNCWVCEGWSEMKFEWRIGMSGDGEEEPVYIHFDFDEYMPWLLHKEEDGSVYYIWKMVPPGRSFYFYSFGGEEGEGTTAYD